MNKRRPIIRAYTWILMVMYAGMCGAGAIQAKWSLTAAFIIGTTVLAVCLINAHYYSDGWADLTDVPQERVE